MGYNTPTPHHFAKDCPMPDSETLRRIDTARDILVGKVPDPKSQVEQITIALVYKFMDDMDQDSIARGGSPSFFTGEYARYAWSSIFNPRLGGQEMLNLYADAITQMTYNTNLPALFRSIFKNAFLPYRDPETLKLFLKTINEFRYEHSEDLGDAFEYLLSIMSSQGEAGQFRTPRHIIDFMVRVVQPQAHETILDPACGTAGFLISAYKYILAANQNQRPGDRLTPLQRTRLLDNFTGYDISPDMVRLSLVNLYLHGFTREDIHIHEYDTLTSLDRWNEYADVILANPPFMSPKGGIRPHTRFSVPSNRSEVLFVDYIAEHLTPHGRGAVIVPEGIIFQSGKAYKDLRKRLVDKNLLWAVVSLPSGVFNPYAGVKTSILFFDRTIAKKTDKILFIKVKLDGYEFGAQRKKIDANDLPVTEKALEDWRLAICNGNQVDFKTNQYMVDAITIEKKTIYNHGQYTLLPERYQESRKDQGNKKDWKRLDSLLEPSGEKVKKNIDVPVMSITMHYGLIDQNKKFKKRIASTDITNYKLVKRDELVVGFPIDEGVLGFQRKYESAAVSPAYDIWKLKTTEINIDFIEMILRSSPARKLYASRMQGAVLRRRTIPKDDFLNLEIPLPPLDVQRQIVDEIAGYQRIIDGARQVVENWKPDILIDPSWQLETLGNLCEIKTGGTPRSSNRNYFDNGTIPWLKSEVCKDTIINHPTNFITDMGFQNSNAKLLPACSTLIALVGATIGKTAYITFESSTNQNIAGLFPKDADVLSPLYLFYSVRLLYKRFVDLGDGNFKMANLSFVKSLQIPLPPLDVQREIVARIERERAIVEANRELIGIYQQKITAAVNRVWESG